MAGTTRLELATSGVTDLHMPPMNTGFQELMPARESSEYIRGTPFGVRFGVHLNISSNYVRLHVDVRSKIGPHLDLPD